MDSVEKKYVDIRTLSSDLFGHKICIRGRIHYTRFYKNMGFIMLRYQQSTIQIVISSDVITPGPFGSLSKLLVESVIECHGVLRASVNKIRSSSYPDFEMDLVSYDIVSPSAVVPFQIETIDSSKEFKNNVMNDTKLNNRWLELRSPVNNSIFRIQSFVVQYFRNYLLKHDFIELHSPKIIGSKSEGGSDVFELEYFDKTAFLAQSPQLYKQMAINSDFDKVFEIGPVFRAEKSQTLRHMCEFIGLDIEMTIPIGFTYKFIQEFIYGLLIHIFDNLKSNHKNLIDCVRERYPIDEITYTTEPLIISFVNCVQMLKENGIVQGDLEDLSSENEKILGQIVKEKYKSDLFIIDQYPSTVRPFYTMQSSNPLYSNSYDIIFRGTEICSGAQRVHDYETLVQKLKEREINPESLKHYLESFKHGSIPHGGCGFGLERIVSLYLGLGSVKNASFCHRDPNRLFP